jgi:aspartate kinase
VVAEADGIRALQAVHGAFALGGEVLNRAEGSEAPDSASNPEAA